MIIRNGLVFRGDGFEEKDLSFENGIITDIAPTGTSDGKSYDVQGAYVLPGFVDIHTHQCVHSNFCGVSPAEIERMLAYYGRQGVTSVVLTTLTNGEGMVGGKTCAALPYLGKKGYGAVLREGSVFDKDEYEEVLGDGVLFHPAVVSAMFSVFGSRRICFVSDRTQMSEIPHKEYVLDGKAIIIKSGCSSHVEGDEIVGSAVNLMDCFRHAVNIGITLEDAVRAVSYNPACAVAIASYVGSLIPGKIADILVLDSDLMLLDVFIAGERQTTNS